jgi:hypothetical protein
MIISLPKRGLLSRLLRRLGPPPPPPRRYFASSRNYDARHKAIPGRHRAP